MQKKVEKKSRKKIKMKFLNGEKNRNYLNQKNELIVKK